MKLRMFFGLCLIAALLFSTIGCKRVEPASQTRGEPTKETVASSQTPTKPEAPGGKETVVAPPPTKAKEAPSPTAKPAARAEPTAKPEEEEPADLASVEELDSYRQLTKTFYEEEGEGAGEWEMLTEFVRDPPAMHMTTRMKDSEGEDFVTEMIQIGDTTYVKSGDEWISMQSSEEDPLQGLPDYVDPAQYPDAMDCDYKGEEKVNGLQTKHYRCDETFLTGIAMGAEEGEILEGEADTWVSTEYNIAVRMILGWKYKDVDGMTGEFRMEFDITDINEDITIEAPEGVEKPGLPDDIPLMDGATSVSSMMGMTTFAVQATAQEVAEFYQEAMPKQGWALKQDQSMIPTMIAFEKAGRMANFMLATEGETTSVTIMLSEE